MFQKYKLIIIIIVIGIIFSYYVTNKNTTPKTIYEIAYDVNDTYGYTVYIEENSIYVPYLVLTNNDNSRTTRC